MNHIRNLQLDPKPALLIDCRFLNQLSPQSLSQTLIQLSYLANENRERRRPWPLYYFNFDMKNENILEARNRLILLMKVCHHISNLSKNSWKLWLQVLITGQLAKKCVSHNLIIQLPGSFHAWGNNLFKSPRRTWFGEGICIDTEV